jgi:F0F1-type ATP synthase assembly protein I
MTVNSEQKTGTEKQKKGDIIRYLGVASTVGINMVVSTFVGFSLGYWVIDAYFNSHPWFTIILTFLGIVGGFKYLFKIAQKAGEKNQDENNRV